MIQQPTFAAIPAALCFGLALLTSQAGAQETAKPAGVLSLCDLESRLTAKGIEIRELELRDNVVEVDGRDSQGRKVELLVDRRSGEILEQKLDR
jgi:hypothetical protein